MVERGTALSVGAEQRLEELDFTLPPPPTPFGAYVEAVQSGNLVFLSGMLPVVGHEPQFIGRVGGELTLEDGREAAATACLSALSAAKAFLGSLDKVTRVAKLGVFIATEGDFREHPKVADGASEILLQVFGATKLSGWRREPATRDADRIGTCSGSRSVNCSPTSRRQFSKNGKVTYRFECHAQENKIGEPR